MSQRAALVVAAGDSRRMGSGVAKPYRELSNGELVLDYSLKAFDAVPRIDVVVIVAAERHMQLARDRSLRFAKVRQVVVGGASRQDSVYKGLTALDAATATVVVHDGARPLVEPQSIERVIDMAELAGAATTASPVVDTLKEVSGDVVTRTVSREGLYAVQTPQAFRYDVLVDAFHKARANKLVATDEAGLVEAAGGEVRIVEMSRRNMKITTEDDLTLVRALLA